MNLGLSGRLTKATIKSPLTPLFLLAAIAVGGDSLQIDSSLPAASVNILMALVLLAVFGVARRRQGATA